MSSVNKYGLIAFLVIVAAGATYVLLRKRPPRLFINEFMARNVSCCPDTVSGAGEFDDWIEIYNAEPTAVDIGGMSFSQDQKRPLHFQVPTTNPALTTIPPGGYLVLWADSSPEQGPLHLKFKLDQDGEYVGLFDSSGRLIDGLKFDRQQADTSYGRSRDGGSTWTQFSVPTPGTANQ